MKVTVLYHEVGAEASTDDLDVLVQRDAVVESLARLGHEVSTLVCSLDLSVVHEEFTRNRPDAVFNLVESLGGTDRAMGLATLLMDAMEIPYTGASTGALLATSDKLSAKRRMLRAGLPTPAWYTAERCGEPELPATPAMPDGAGVRVACVIVKPVWEHASWGMDDSSVFHASDRGEIDRRIAARCQETGRPHFAERFVDGREFNVSLLAADRRRAGDGSRPAPPEPVVTTAAATTAAATTSAVNSATANSATANSATAAGGVANSTTAVATTAATTAARTSLTPQVLPPAEIDFSGLGPDKPHIVGYRAKWDEESPEYQGTTRRFDFAKTDGPLLDELARLARACWDLFELNGYARVDFRVDTSGRPWILEINANPCLAPDAGFAAALTRQGLSFDRAIQRILASAACGR